MSTSASYFVFVCDGQLTYVNALAHTSRTSKVVEVGLGKGVHSVVLAVDAVWNLDLDGAQALQVRPSPI